MARVSIVNLNVYALVHEASGAPMGGAELDMYTLAHSLGENHEVSIVTGDWGQKEVEFEGNICVYRSARLGGNYLIGVYRLWRALRKAEADVYISSGAGAEVGIIALYCRCYKKRYLYRTASNMDCNGEFVRSNPLAGKLYEFGLRRADTIVTSVRKHQAMLLERYANLSSKLTYIPLGLSRAKNVPQPRREEILWVGRCDPVKRPDRFLDLATQLPQYSFTMVMATQPHFAKLERQVRERAATLPNLRLVASLPFRETQAYFERASITVNTSDTEGFTFTLLQSGLAGTPVAYLTVDPDGVITRYGLGIWAEGNLKQLVQGIDTLLRSREEWQVASKAIYHYVEKHHGMAEVRRQWEKLLAEPSGKIP